jgi:hypothetical protein
MVSNKADQRHGKDTHAAEGAGAAFGGGGLLTGLGIMAIPGVDPVVAA